MNKEHTKEKCCDCIEEVTDICKGECLCHHSQAPVKKEKDTMYVSHGQIIHSISECIHCDDCIKVKETFEQAKKDGTLDKMVSPTPIEKCKHGIIPKYCWIKDCPNYGINFANHPKEEEVSKCCGVCNNCKPNCPLRHVHCYQCRCHKVTHTPLESEPWEELELGGEIIDFEGELRPNGIEKLKQFISQTLTEALSKRDEEWREKLSLSIGMLRQWLNEDRIDDPNKMVTNKEIETFLDLLNTKE